MRVRPFGARARATARWRLAPVLRAASCALALALASSPVQAEGALGALLGREAPPAPAAREFAADDLAQAQRAAIATLQDLGFALEDADAARGVVIASRLDGYPLRLTVTLASAGDAAVRAEVATDLAGAPISDSGAAEAFFAAFAAQLEPTEVTF